MQLLSIPLLDQLIPDGISPGTCLLVEYDTQSQWFAIATTLTARWLKAGFRSVYVAEARPREQVVNDFTRLGVDVSAKEEAGLLRVDDWHSATLTPEQTSVDDVAVEGRHWQYGSVKIADISVGFSKQLKGQAQLLTKWSEEQLGVLAIHESSSVLLRFNEEKAFLEWFENRDVPLQRKFKRVTLWGFGRGLHSEPFYKRLENIVNGVVEVRVMDRENEVKNVMRITSLKGQRHDSHWHEIEIKQNGEAVLSS